MANQEQIKQASAKLYLNLDNPQSVKKQLQRINQAQKELRQLKGEVNSKIQEVNQPVKSFGIDEAASIGLHIFGQHRIANQVTRQGNQAERRGKNQQNKAKQPLIRMRELIDKYIFEGDRLKLMAQNYLQENK
ncbi:hypothetical protein [Pleurocapsa sp. FMAR1]|uniref:hypothetical protein n=1 Tax=Pleurocapsa sp. FMAR1 TaxID=3040204 RepID=UPI0029C8607B|nr:hypothetical protein [Pleurocapsa sp. FMAR1]